MCGWQLEECCLDDHQHRQLLSCSSQFLEEGANSFHDNRREVAEVKAFCIMLAEEGPFGAVVDGLNAAYSGGRISGHKVGVAVRLAALTPPPPPPPPEPRCCRWLVRCSRLCLVGCSS